MQNKLAETEVHAGHECHEQEDEDKNTDNPTGPFADSGRHDFADLVDSLADKTAYGNEWFSDGFHTRSYASRGYKETPAPPETAKAGVLVGWVTAGQIRA